MNPSSSPESPASRRDTLIDTLRGAGVVLVCLSHFAETYLARTDAVLSARWLQLFAMVAAPTFFLVSGMTSGYRFESAPERFPVFRAKLLDRGLFLLTVVHLLLVLTELPFLGGLRAALRVSFVTDPIGFAIIIGPLVLVRSSRRTRAALGAALVMASWVGAHAWHPTAWPAVAMRALLVGEPDSQTRSAVFPFLPWLGVYLIGTILGQAYGLLRRERPTAHVEYFFLRLGIAAMVAAGLLAGGYRGVAALVRSPVLLHPAVRRMFAAGQKFPPSPVYFSFFGGGGLVIAAVLAYLERVDVLAGPRRVLTILGQTALFVFTLQSFVFYYVFWTFRVGYTPWWPLIFLALMSAMTLAAAWWLAAGLNRLLSLKRVGLGRALAALSALTGAVPGPKHTGGPGTA